MDMPTGDPKQDELFAPGGVATIAGKQLCLLDPIAAKRGKITPLPVDISSPAHKARATLEAKYRDVLVHRLDFRRLVTYVPNKDIPVYNWFKYKEGFSRQLVFHLAKEFGLAKGDLILDPFAGCGTTLLAAKELGLPALGFDILPVSVFVAQVKLMDWPNLDVLLAAVDKLMGVPYRPPQGTLPDVRIINLAFSRAVQSQLLFYKQEIAKFEPPLRDFLMLGLLSILESVSSTSKDGQFLRLVQRKIPPVKDALRSILTLMVSDLSSRQQTLFRSGNAKAEMLEGDARQLPLHRKYEGKISAVITSPPYLNRYDYSRTYALELCLLSVNSPQDMVRVRHSLLRSHIESREHTGKQITLPALDEILDGLAHQKLNNERMPIMVQGYFEDMNLVISSLGKYVKPGGRVALVVANAQFAGESVPTDLMLSELAADHGFKTEEIWITRYKGNSSQQMAIYGRRPVRESIVFWRKDAWSRPHGADGPLGA